MILRILGCGTSTGVPIPGCSCKICCSSNPRNHRTRTSALVITDQGKNILIDTSTDLRFQALRNSIARVDAVLYTHTHADHIFGIDDLRSFNFGQRTAIPCYGTPQTFRELRRIFSYIFDPDPDYEGGQVPQLSITEIDDKKSFQLFDVDVQPFPLQHGRTSVTGFRFGDLAYATDCNVIPALSRELLRGIKFLILDGLRYEPHKTHFSIPEAIEVCKELGSPTTYLIHMTHSIEYEEVNAKLPAHIRLAYDGLEIRF